MFVRFWLFIELEGFCWRFGVIFGGARLEDMFVDKLAVKFADNCTDKLFCIEDRFVVG